MRSTALLLAHQAQICQIAWYSTFYNKFHFSDWISGFHQCIVSEILRPKTRYFTSSSEFLFWTDHYSARVQVLWVIQGFVDHVSIWTNCAVSAKRKNTFANQHYTLTTDVNTVFDAETCKSRSSWASSRGVCLSSAPLWPAGRPERTAAARGAGEPRLSSGNAAHRTRDGHSVPTAAARTELQETDSRWVPARDNKPTVTSPSYHSKYRNDKPKQAPHHEGFWNSPTCRRGGCRTA